MPGQHGYVPCKPRSFVVFTIELLFFPREYAGEFSGRLSPEGIWV